MEGERSGRQFTLRYTYTEHRKAVVMMASVRKLLIENGLGRIAAQAEAAVKYSAELSIGKPGEGNTHRLGGRPNTSACN